MIIDFNQQKDTFQISYVNENGQIDIVNVPLIHGYYKYIATDDYNNNAEKNLKSFKYESPIVKESAKYFSGHNINEFINHDIKVYHKEIWNKISLLNIPPPFSIDIETKITDEYGYSTAEKAENPILSISITDYNNLDTLIFELKNQKNSTITDKDNIEIDSHIKNILGETICSENNFKFSRRIFNTETEMLTVFLECINKYFHSIFGWNFERYDWVYIYNRCKILGINLKIASPVFKIYDKKLDSDKKDKSKEKLVIKKPLHRLIGDYMIFFKESLIYNNLGNYSLEAISQLILGTGKVQYTGNLRSLYENDYNKFVAYAIVDTILVMLIHKKTNLYNIDFFECYYNGIAYNKISQNAISEALIYNELREDNKFLLESEYNEAVKIKYPGGYVKMPTKKINNASIGVDFSGLYPNSMITMGISPDKKLDKIDVDENGYPIDEENNKIWLNYFNQNCILAPTGRIYSKDSDGIYTRIEKKLIQQRKIFKQHAEDIYLNIIPKIEKLIQSK